MSLIMYLITAHNSLFVNYNVELSYGLSLLTDLSLDCGPHLIVLSMSSDYFVLDIVDAA